jgi:hypothetical protein
LYIKLPPSSPHVAIPPPTSWPGFQGGIRLAEISDASTPAGSGTLYPLSHGISCKSQRSHRHLERRLRVTLRTGARNSFAFFFPPSQAGPQMHCPARTEKKDCERDRDLLVKSVTKLVGISFFPRKARSSSCRHRNHARVTWATECTVRSGIGSTAPRVECLYLQTPAAFCVSLESLHTLRWRCSLWPMC